MPWKARIHGKLARAEGETGYRSLFWTTPSTPMFSGVLMTRRAVSSGQQFNIRGYGNGVGFRGATNNFDGQGYKVYFNNIPITDAEGVTLLDDIDFGSVGSVDVIKGPAGSLYGLAIAGVVNLKTIHPEAGETSISQSTGGKLWAGPSNTISNGCGKKLPFVKLWPSNFGRLHGPQCFQQGLHQCRDGIPSQREAIREYLFWLQQ
ncbi:MAG: TonB-dependent receptor plug domain-containing protein [Flavobacteriaceae bacterium]